MLCGAGGGVGRGGEVRFGSLAAVSLLPLIGSPCGRALFSLLRGLLLLSVPDRLPGLGAIRPSAGGGQAFPGDWGWAPLPSQACAARDSGHGHSGRRLCG